MGSLEALSLPTPDFKAELQQLIKTIEVPSEPQKKKPKETQETAPLKLDPIHTIAEYEAWIAIPETIELLKHVLIPAITGYQERSAQLQRTSTRPSEEDRINWLVDLETKRKFYTACPALKALESHRNLAPDELLTIIMNLGTKHPEYFYPPATDPLETKTPAPTENIIAQFLINNDFIYVSTPESSVGKIENAINELTEREKKIIQLIGIFVGDSNDFYKQSYKKKRINLNKDWSSDQISAHLQYVIKDFHIRNHLDYKIAATEEEDFNQMYEDFIKLYFEIYRMIEAAALSEKKVPGTGSKELLANINVSLLKKSTDSEGGINKYTYFKLLDRLNRNVFNYKSDPMISKNGEYLRGDVWSSPQLSCEEMIKNYHDEQALSFGDCEESAFLNYTLIKNYFPRSAVYIFNIDDNTGDGHATLITITSVGDNQFDVYSVCTFGAYKNGQPIADNAESFETDKITPEQAIKQCLKSAFNANISDDAPITSASPPIGKLEEGDQQKWIGEKTMNTFRALPKLVAPVLQVPILQVPIID